MPRPFDITTTGGEVALDASGRARAVFTVSNISGRSRRGRARVIPGEGAQAAWFTVEGEAEREFTGERATHQVGVSVQVPTGTAPGSYRFGLDVVSVENPDEEWSEGPKVGFTVAPSAPPKKPFPWWIVVVAVLGLALVGGVLAFLGSRGGCTTNEDCGQGEICEVKEAGKPGRCRPNTLLAPCAQDGDCLAGQQCAALGELKVCLLQLGQPCSAPQSCASGFCQGKVCTASGIECGPDRPCPGKLRCVQGQCIRLFRPTDLEILRDRVLIERVDPKLFRTLPTGPQQP
jgi:hypothetical protein